MDRIAEVASGALVVSTIFWMGGSVGFLLCTGPTVVVVSLHLFSSNCCSMMHAGMSIALLYCGSELVSYSLRTDASMKDLCLHHSTPSSSSSLFVLLGFISS